MSTGDGIPYKSQNPIQVHSNQKNYNLELCKNEQNLVVYWNEKSFIENSTQEKSKVIICHLEGYSLDDLIFTGSEFDNVVLVAGRNIDTTSQEFLIVLYKIISRARKTLKVFSHPSNLAEFKSLLTLSDTDVYFDKQRCDNNFSSIAFQDIKELDYLEVGKVFAAMTALKKDPQSLYNKAFLQYLKADEKLFDPIMSLPADLQSSLLKKCNLDPDLTREHKHLLEISQLLTRSEDRPEWLDLCCKLVDAVFSTGAELLESVFRVDELPFPVDKQFFLDNCQYLLLPVIKFCKDTIGPFLMKSGVASIILNAEQFWQFLKKQAITLEEVFTMVRFGYSELHHLS